MLMLAGELDGWKPKEVVEQALISARDGDLAVVVDRTAGLWIGEGRLRQVATLESVPTGLALGEDLALWRVAREGLWTRTTVEIRDRGGAVLRTETTDGPATDVLPLPGGFVVSLPGELRLIAGDAPVRVIPLPFLVTESLELDDGWMKIYGDGGSFSAVDLESGCPSPLPDEGDPLTRLIRWRAREACADQRALPADVLIEAEEARAAAIRGAVAARSPALLAALGVRTRDDISALAPGAVQGTTRLTFLGDQQLSAPSGTFGHAGAILLQDVDTDLAGWAKRPWGPACNARILLIPTSASRAARYSQHLARLHATGEPCADQVALMPVGTLRDPVAGPTIRYTAPNGNLLARRTGLAGPMQVRLDVASLTPQGDPLTALGKLPLYAPAWIVPAARAFEATLDVDGSLVAAAGWEIIRVDPGGRRVARKALPGPVHDLAIRKNGTIDAVVGGQRVVIDLDKDEVHWHEAGAADQPTTPARETGPWSVEGTTVRRAASSGRPALVRALPVELRAIAALSAGAVVETDLGLFGLDEDGAPSWRLPDTGTWAVSDRTLIASTAGGLAGFELGR